MDTSRLLIFCTSLALFLISELIPSHGYPIRFRQIVPNAGRLTTHILDTSNGGPAAEVGIVLSKMEGGSWRKIGLDYTNADGRASNLHGSNEFTQGIYNLHFDTTPYFLASGQETFYPHIEVTFQVDNPNEHYHVPIIITPYGYSTYRGS